MVQFGNMCCARVALLVILCLALGVHWVDAWHKQGATKVLKNSKFVTSMIMIMVNHGNFKLIAIY